MTKKKVSPIKSYVKNGQKFYKFPTYLGVNPLTGKQIRSTSSNHKTRREAELALARIKLAVANGTYHQKRAETYQEVYNLWIKQYENTVEESTYVKTISIFKNHILPAMGTYRIDKIHVDICQKHVDEWASKLKKFRIVKSYAARVLDFAIKRGYIQTNPFTHVDIPTNISKKYIESVKDKVKNFYTREQLIEFLLCLKRENNYKVFALFFLLAFTGMRKGEVLALTWNDLDFSTNEICINKALSKGKENKLYIKTPKSGLSRTIEMDDKAVAVLKEWKRKQQQDYLKLGFNTYNPKQLVFSNEKNEFVQPTMLRKWIINIQKKYKLANITTHGLRHTHCSLLLEVSANMTEVKDRLGHTDINTTMNIYAHATKKAKKEAIIKFSNYIDIE